MKQNENEVFTGHSPKYKRKLWEMKLELNSQEYGKISNSILFKAYW